jgi:NAD(P)-dependent dehydrogenase (short-subunit alcohol dehydrogenase family)
MTDNKTAVVAGGTGGIGEGLVQALIAGGYEAYVPVRDIDQTERLKDYLADSPHLHPVPANLAHVRTILGKR